MFPLGHQQPPAVHAGSIHLGCVLHAVTCRHAAADMRVLRQRAAGHSGTCGSAAGGLAAIRDLQPAAEQRAPARPAAHPAQHHRPAVPAAGAGAGAVPRRLPLGAGGWRQGFRVHHRLAAATPPQLQIPLLLGSPHRSVPATLFPITPHFSSTCLMAFTCKTSHKRESSGRFNRVSNQ